MVTTIPYRITGRELIQTLDNWECIINFRVNLIACGGTALTLLGIKESTKDIDLIVPIHKQHVRLMSFLWSLGYEEKGGGLVHPDDPFFIYQFWAGNRVFTTDLLHSPLDPGRNISVKKWSHIYLGTLNLIDLFITKLFRGTLSDIDDCVAAYSISKIDPEELLEKYAEAAKYDINPDKMMQNFLHFAQVLFEKKIVRKTFVEKIKSHA